MGKVKCYFCDQYFNWEKEPFKKIGRRYAHATCYEKNYDEDLDYKEKIYEVVKTYLHDYNYAVIERQRKSYNTKGISNKEIYLTLLYYYEVLKKSPEAAQGRIGIVPYIIDDARAYYEQKNKAQKNLSSFQNPDRVNINIEKIIDRNTSKKTFLNLEELE